jgi:hypothetical protein
LEHASVVWNSITSTDASKLERIQQKFASLCFYCFVPYILNTDALEQRFSNYGPRTTSGAQGVPLWSFKKDRRKNKI